jgi:hypothetical protein
MMKVYQKLVMNIVKEKYNTFHQSSKIGFSFIDKINTTYLKLVFIHGQRVLQEF